MLYYRHTFGIMFDNVEVHLLQFDWDHDEYVTSLKGVRLCISTKT